MNKALYFVFVLMISFSITSVYSAGEWNLQDFEIPTNSEITCQGEKSIGFAWDNGKLIEKEFSLIEYKVIKRPKDYSDAFNIQTCDIIVSKSQTSGIVNSYQVLLPRCYSIYTNETNDGFLSLCNEFYRPHSKQFLGLFCQEDNLSLAPNNSFIASGQNSDIFEEKKTLIYVEHGKCGELQKDQ